MVCAIGAYCVGVWHPIYYIAPNAKPINKAGTIIIRLPEPH